jgi:hypothetical protein
MKNNGNKGIDVDRNGATLEGSKASQKNSSKSK